MTTAAPLGSSGSTRMPGTSARWSQLVNHTGSPETNGTSCRCSGSDCVSCVTAPSSSSTRKRSGGASGRLSTQTSAAPSGVKHGA